MCESDTAHRTISTEKTDHFHEPSDKLNAWRNTNLCVCIVWHFAYSWWCNFHDLSASDNLDMRSNAFYTNPAPGTQRTKIFQHCTQQKQVIICIAMLNIHLKWICWTSWNSIRSYCIECPHVDLLPTLRTAPAQSNIYAFTSPTTPPTRNAGMPLPSS